MPENITYSIELPDGRTTQWSKDQYDKASEKLYEKYPDAKIVRTSALDDTTEQTEDTYYHVALPDGRQTVWDAQTYNTKGADLTKKYPKAQISVLEDVTSARNRSFAREYEAALDKSAMVGPFREGEEQANEEYLAANANRYMSLKQVYGRQEPQPPYPDVPGEEPVTNYFARLKQNTNRMWGDIVYGAGELIDINSRSYTGPMRVNQDLAKEALSVLEEREKNGEPALRLDELMKQDTKSMSKEEKDAYNHAIDVERYLSLRGAGDNTDSAKQLLTREIYGDKEGRKLKEKGAKIQDENSQEGAGFAAKAADLTYLAGSGVAAIGATMLGHPEIGAAIGDAAFATFAASSAGSAMRQARDAGATDEQTFAAGATSAAIMGLVGRIPFVKALGNAGRVASTEAAEATMKALGNPAVRATLEKETSKLAKEAAEAVGMSASGYMKRFAGQVASSTTTFAAMGGLEAAVPLIYANPDEYPALNQIAKSVASGAVDGAIMGVLFGGVNTGSEYLARRKHINDQYAKHGGVVAAALDFGKGEARVWDAKSRQFVPVESVPQNGWGEILNVQHAPGVEGGAAEWVHVYSNGKYYIVKPSAVVPETVTMFKPEGLAERSRRSFTEQGAEEGRAADTPLLRGGIRQEKEYLERKAAVEERNGGITEATQLDIERNNAALSGRRDAALSELVQRLGNKQFWIARSGPDHSVINTVHSIVYADGKEVFVVSQDSEGNYAVINPDGKPGFLSQNDINNGIADGSIVDESVKPLDDYLDSRVVAQDAADEELRMREDLSNNIASIIEKVMYDGKINIGTAESENWATVKDYDPSPRGGVVVETDKGDVTLSWQRVADAIGMPLKPMTNEEIAVERIKEETPGAVVPEQEPVEESAEPAATTEEAQPVEDNTPRDFRGNEIPLKDDGEVNETAFWNKDPEAWAKWNDEKRQDGGTNSRGYIAKAKKKLEGDVKGIQKQLDNELDFDRIAQLEKQRDGLSNRIADLDRIEQDYVAAEAASNAEAGSPAVAAEQVAPAEAQPVQEIGTPQAAEPAGTNISGPSAPESVAATPAVPSTPAEALEAGFNRADERLRSATTEEERQSAMQEKRQALQDYYDSLNTGDETIVGTRADILQRMDEAGCSEFQIEAVREQLNEQELTEGFRAKGKIFIVADDVRNAGRAKLVHLHEHWHNVNKAKGYPKRLAKMDGVDANGLLRIANKMAGVEKTNGYGGYLDYQNPKEALADEVISLSMEIVSESTPENVDGNLRDAGLDNQEIINFVKTIYDGERRNGQDVSLAGRGLANDGNLSQESPRQDGRDSSAQPEGNLVSPGSGTEEVGVQGAGSRGQEVTGQGPEGAMADGEGGALEQSAADLANNGIATNGDEVKFSVRYVPSEGELDKIAGDISEQVGVTKEEAKRWVESETSLAAIITGDSAILDYEGDDRYTAIKNDSDYPQGTVDFNNICRKRLAFTEMYQRVQRAFPNTIITGQDLATIRNIMKDHGLTVACGLCYVEDRRQLLGEIAKDFIDNVRSDFSGYVSRGGEAKKKNAEKFRTLISGDSKADLSIYDLITLDGSAKLLLEHPGLYKAFQAFNNARGQQSGNLFQGYAEYKREILKWSKKKVKSVNDNGGLRIFSYSDFEAHHLIDLVQIIQDCARMGVKIQGYTKVPAFARAVAQTGIKLNRSLIPLGDTGIQDGKLAFDPVEGIDINDPDFLPSNDNIGNILIGINDEQIRLAMADPFVHFIIPYHSNQKDVLRSMKQTGAWTNYKLSQTEKDATGKTAEHVNIYTDVLNAAEAEGAPIKNEREFTERFLAVCKERGLTPRFAQFLDKDANGDYVYTPGYYKFLVDFKLFNENGDILPQAPVKAVFDDQFNAKILNDYVRDEKAKFGENLDDVYDEIVSTLGLESRKPDTEDNSVEAMLNSAKNIREANATQKQPVSDRGDEAVSSTDVEGDVLFRLSKNNKSTIESWLKKREDLTDEQRAEVVGYIDGLADAKTQLATARWFTNGTIRIPEDMPKVEQAVEVASKAKVDPLHFNSPMELLEAHAEFKPTAKRINPDEVSTLHRAAEYPDQGIVVYDVDNTKASRENMRKIINTHFGDDASPWCLLQGDGNGNLTPSSERYWRHYNAYPKQVAFKDGKLLAFSANDTYTRLWWDRQDKSHYGIPMSMKVPDDELGRSADYIIDESGNPSIEPGGRMHRGNKQNGVYEEWSSNGETILLRTEYKDGKENGVTEQWYPSGQIWKRSVMKDDDYAGTYEMWYENGQQKMRVGMNEKGEKDGEQIGWYKNGNKQYEAIYKNGNYAGDRIDYFESGEPKSIIHYDDNGDMTGTEDYVVWLAGEGQKKHVRLARKVSYAPGDSNRRTVEEYYSNGNLRKKEEFHGQRLDGVVEYYYSDGTIQSRTHYEEGNRHGIKEVYRENGMLWLRGPFKYGEVDGIQEQWDKDGNLILREEWKDGERVRTLPVDGEEVKFRKATSQDLTDAQKRAIAFVDGKTTAEADALSFAMEKLGKDGVSIDDKALLDGYGLSNVTMTKKGDVVTLNKVVAAEKKQGNGTRFMNDLVKTADERGLTLALTPDDSFGATSIARLKKFYKRFGFKDNKGRNADLTINESMVRRPEDDLRFRKVNPIIDEKNEELFQQAKKTFGTTKNLAEAGYVLPDGDMLDFSGRHLVDKGSDTSWMNGMRQVDHRDISDLNYEKDLNTPSGYETDMPDFIRRGAIRVHLGDNYGMVNLAAKPTRKQENIIWNLASRTRGNVSVDFGDGWDVDHYATYENARPERIVNDIRRYFDEGVEPDGNVMFRKSNQTQNGFISNAEAALDKIKMEKATPEQWAKMLEKEGGLKAGEDKWLGLSDWLKEQDKKSIAKRDIADYIAENRIQIEEVNYAENVDMEAETQKSIQDTIAQGKSLEELQDEIDEIRDSAARFDFIGENPTDEDMDAFLTDAMVETYGDDFRIGYVIEDGDIDYNVDPYSLEEEEFNRNISGTRKINITRLDYTTEGLDNKREIALTVPTIEPWNETDNIHFGDAGEGRAVAWIRFGDARTERGAGDAPIDVRYKGAEPTDEPHRRAIEGILLNWNDNESFMRNERKENQFIAAKSMFENSLRDNYYEGTDEQRTLRAQTLGVLDEIKESDFEPIYEGGQRVLVIDEIQSKRHQEARENGYIDESRYTAERQEKPNNGWVLYKDGNYLGFVNVLIAETEKDAIKAAINYDRKRGIPAAPFEKNWHELAMKRMLRLAAEEGYDKIAWTTGDQQAERYSLSNIVDKVGVNPITKGDHAGNRIVQLYLRHSDGDYNNLVVDKDGMVIEGDYAGQKLSAVVGSELAAKIMGVEGGRKEISGDGLRVGGEGMRGFYDDILPRFMNKYGKKWGVKVQDIDLPGIGEAGTGLTMHSVDVTPEMKESVMEGQVMFRKASATTEDGEEISYESMGSLDTTRRTSLVERTYRKTGAFSFTGREKIESAADVAYIFKELETEAVENSFIVFVKDGKPTILHTGIGDISSTTIDSAPMVVGMKDFAPDEVYMVHNHPSGRVEASRADWKELEKLQKIAGETPVQGVIIDTVTGEYGVFDTEYGGTLAITDERKHDESENIPLEVLSFDKMVFSDEYKAEIKGRRMTSASEVAAYLSAHRLGEGSKVGALLVDRKGMVTGNLVFNGNYIDKDNARDFAGDAADAAIRSGAEQVILFGDFDYSRGPLSDFRQALSDLSGGVIRLTDVVKVDGNHTRSLAEGTLMDSGDKKKAPASEYGDAEVRFRKVSNQETIDRLESEPKVKVYRSMQKVDGKYYPPMAARVDGEWQNPSEFGAWEESEERPDMVDDNGQFKLDKGNGKSLKAAYAPYFHSRLSPLNEQFSEAYNRDNLVIVEGEVPESELTSGYTAEKSKKSTGVHDWPSGRVSNALAKRGEDTRKVILSRWFKPVREVPASEVADIIAAKLKGSDITFPYNVVTPALRGELAKRGVQFKGWQGNKPENWEQIVSEMKRQNRMAMVVEKARTNGIAGVIGEEDTKDFYMDVYRAVSPEIRERIAARAEQSGWNMREAISGYLSDLAAKPISEDETGTLRVAAGILSGYAEGIDEKTAQYILFRGEKSGEGDIIETARDIAKRKMIGVGEFYEPVMFRLSDDIEGNRAMAGAIADDAKEMLESEKSEAKKDKLFTTVKAMSLQKQYDSKTVNAITSAAKSLLKEQGINALTRHEIARLLGMVSTSVGRSPAIVKRNADALVNMVIDHLIKEEKSSLDKLMKVKASKVNPSGVEVIGALDVRGQNTVKAFRAGLDMQLENPNDEYDETTITGRLAALEEKMTSSDDAVRAEAEDEYAGLTLAKEYQENIRNSENEERGIKNEMQDAAQALRDGDMSRTAYRQFVKEAENSIRENQIERIEAYRDLRAKMLDMMSGSAEARKEFQEREKARVEEIHHNANSDMQGEDASPFRKPTALGNLANSSLVRFFASSLATFDQMLRFFGKKSINGEGYLWNRYMRGWNDATENAFTGQKQAKEELDAKVSEVFDKKMLWSDLYAEERKMPTVKVKWWDGGKMADHELTQGNLLYIYMVNKMSDGRMKLRRMGIDEDLVEAIKEKLDPRFIELADWLQDEYLVNKRNKYNAVHERLFGASMSAIENYFPLKINKRSLNKAEDIGRPEFDDALPATTTGSIIKRRRNAQDLDLLNADAFSVVIEHVEQMEQWAAFAELNKDINTLLSYKRFRNQVMNMTSVYGSGTKLWNTFKNVARIAGGTYRPSVKAESLDTAAMNIAKGVTAAKISFRVYTALKQFLSMPAFLSDASPRYLAENLAAPWKAWNWAMENLPVFEKRWKSRIAGDTRLMNTDSDWKFFRSNIYDTISRLGMSPNAFVDALTVSIGSHSMYQTRYAQYIKDGYPEEKADKMAKQDATILYNETQQSSEGAFVSPVQLDRTVMSSMITVFRNSSMGYQRQLHDAIRNLGKMMKKGYKQESIEFMAKQMARDGLTEEQAQHAAERRYGRAFWHNAVRVATFGFIVEFAWNLGGSIAYLLFGDDDDEKKGMLEEAAIHALVGGPIEGLAGGNVASEVLNMVAKGENLRSYDPTLLPIIADAKRTMQMMSYDPVAGANELLNLAVQAGLGVNPQTLTDSVVAVIDACGGDLETSKEAMLLIMRVLQVPQSQVDKIYIDELGVKASTAKRMSYSQMARRYAEYKVMKGAPLTGWAYSDKAEEKREQAYLKRFKTMVNERKKKK